MPSTSISYKEKNVKERTVKYPMWFDSKESAMQVSAFSIAIPHKKTRLAELLSKNLYKSQRFEVFKNGVSTGSIIDVMLVEFLDNPTKFCSSKKDTKIHMVNVDTKEIVPSAASMNIGTYGVSGWGLSEQYDEINADAMTEYANILYSYDSVRFGKSTFSAYAEANNNDVDTVAAQIIVQRNALYGENNARGNNNIFDDCIESAAKEVIDYIDNQYERIAYKIAVRDKGIQTADEYRNKRPSSFSTSVKVKQPCKSESSNEKTYETVEYKIDGDVFTKLWLRTHEKMNDYITENYPKYKEGRGVETLKCTVCNRNLDSFYDQKIVFGNLPYEFIDGVKRTKTLEKEYFTTSSGKRVLISGSPYAWIRTRSKNGYLVELGGDNTSVMPNLKFVYTNPNFNDWMVSNTRERTGIYAHIATAVTKKIPNYTESFKKGLLNNSSVDGVDVNQELALLNSTLDVSFATKSYVDMIEGLHEYYKLSPNDNAFQYEDVCHLRDMYGTDAHRIMLGMFASTKENIVVNADLTCSIHKDVCSDFFYWMLNRKNKDNTPYYSPDQLKYIKDVKHMRNSIRRESKLEYDRNLIKSKWDLTHTIKCSKENCPEYRLSMEKSNALGIRTKALFANVTANTFAGMYKKEDAPSVIGMEKANFNECKKTRYEKSFKSTILTCMDDSIDKKSLEPSIMYSSNAYNIVLTKKMSENDIKTAFANNEYWNVVDVTVDGMNCKITALPTVSNLTKRLRGEFGHVMKTMGCMSDMKNIVSNKVSKFNDGKAAFVRLVSAFNSSQKCSHCGYVHKDNRNGRNFVCKRCGFSTDSDYNASLNHQMNAQSVKIKEDDEPNAEVV